MNVISYAIVVAVIGYSLLIMVKNSFRQSSGKSISSQNTYPSYEATKKDLVTIMVLSLFVRMLFYLFSVQVIFTFIVPATQPVWDKILDRWSQWDAKHYINITEGYTSYDYELDGVNYYPGLAFFPLYPTLLKAMRLIIPNPIIAGMLLSSILFSIACLFFYKLVALDYGKSIANKAYLLLNLFPFSFYFGAVATESTFLLFSTLTLFFIRKHRWLQVGLFGFLTALTKYLGVFLVFPAFVEICEEYQVLKHIKDIKYLFRTIAPKVLPLLLIPCGTLIFLYINASQTGNSLYFLDLQKGFYQNAFQPFFAIFSRIHELLVKEPFLINKIFNWILPMMILIIVYLTLVLHAGKHKTMYPLWLILQILINTSITYPISTGRFFACATPLFIFWAVSLENKPKLSKAVSTFCFMLLACTYTVSIVYKIIM